MDICKTLKTLNEAFGPSGNEKEVAAVLEQMAKPYVDEITTDVLGNLICHKKGSGPKVMLAAHMDSIGIMVTYIEKGGFLRFGKVGGLTPANLLYTPVRFKNGVCGIIAADEEAETGKLKIDDLYVDIGADSKKAAKELVSVGDMAVYNSATFKAGDCVISPYQDDRIACIVMLMVMEEMKQTENDLYFVFTVQEEVGPRGAATSAYGIEPDYAIAIDVTGSDDTPGTKHMYSSAQGKGAAIKVMDDLMIAHPKMVKMLKKLAEEKKIDYQMDVIQGGGTDGGPIHVSHAGVYTGGISIPCRHIHTPAESVRRSDVEACVKLTCAFVESKLDKEC